jgi:hypothetical protein
LNAAVYIVAGCGVFGGCGCGGGGGFGL